MATYIERGTYRNRLADLESWCQDLRKPGLKQALEMLDEVPVADVVEIVRCKECESAEESDNHEYVICCNLGVGMEKDDYCSRGVRKDGGERNG